MVENKIFRVIEIEKDKLKKNYEDYLGYIFRDDNNKLNRPTSVKEIAESNKWTNYNLPCDVWCIELGSVKRGDKFIANCNNSGLNNRVYTYVDNAEDTDLVDCVTLINDKGETIRSTKFILDGALKVYSPSNNDLNNIIQYNHLMKFL